ncbi:diguanylate cyclase [Deinococcus sp. SDU3-2]|uniref:Diguanylate cyclase n=1 Tax=Deinococcus terrestris TaxID=2651870 RepID=A0A7X1NVP7_9DEIO|nr:diguanylate cyclase [Deinococcus terrestris]MPY66269.1 diguanylate cyclase [Deinococcus terrestris]
MLPSAVPGTLSPPEQLDLAWNLQGSDPARARAIAQAWEAHPEFGFHAQAVLGAVAFEERESAQAQALSLEAAEGLRAADDLKWLARSLMMAALASDVLGQRDQALAQHHAALEVARTMGDLLLQGSILMNIGVLWFITDPRKAEDYFCTAIEVLEEVGPRGQGNLSRAYLNLGILRYQAGEQDEGTTWMERGRDLASATKQFSTWASAVCHLAQVHTERGDVATARRDLESALNEMPQLGGRARQNLLYSRVIVEHHAGEYQAALEAYEELRTFALSELEQQAVFPIRVDSHAKLGQFEQAYALSQELVAFNEQLYKKERETELLKLEERHQAETARREAELQRLEAEAARRDAELKHLENVELQRALESNATLIQSLRESQLVSETLLGVSQLMQLDLDPPDLARHAVALVMGLVDADWCTLARIHSDEVAFETVWARDEQSDTFVRLQLPGVLSVRDPLLHRSARQDEPTFVSGYPQERVTHPALVAAGLQGFASLPAGTANNFTYVLLLGRMNQDVRWSERDRRVLGATGRALRVAVEEQERSRRTREAALTDILTGLGNRRAFEAQVREAAARATFSVAMLDLDGLKRVNDTRGHAAGDMLLQVFASTLRASAAEHMGVFRLGGDEIALLVEHGGHASPELVQADVLEVLDAGVAAARAAGFPEAGCSFGVARWPDEAATVADVIALADTRLYADKEARKARRIGQLSRQDPAPRREVVSFGTAALDLQARELRGPLGRVKLNVRESEILQALAARSQQVVPRAQLMGAGGTDSGGTLDAYVSTLRRKLASVTEQAGIRTVRGQGFSLHWYLPRSEG